MTRTARPTDSFVRAFSVPALEGPCHSIEGPTISRSRSDRAAQKLVQMYTKGRLFDSGEFYLAKQGMAPVDDLLPLKAFGLQPMSPRQRVATIGAWQRPPYKRGDHATSPSRLSRGSSSSEGTALCSHALDEQHA